MAHHSPSLKPVAGTASNPAHPLSRGLVLHLPLLEGGGARAADHSGLNNHGTLQNSPVWAPGRFGPSLPLVSASSQYVQLANTTSLNITGPITMAMWLKTTSAGTSAANLIGGYQGVSPFAGYGLALNISGTSVLSYWSGTTNAWRTASVTVNDGIWHHVAVTVEGTAVTYYVDGVQVGTATSNQPNTFSGTRNIGANTVPGSYLNGSLDDVRIYNRALSAPEIQQIYLQPYASFVSRPRTTFFVDGGSFALTGAATSVSTTSGSTAVGFAAQGTASCIASTSATGSVAYAMAGSLSAVSTTSANRSVAFSLAGSATSVVTVGGSLSSGNNQALTGSATAVASAAGSVGIGFSLSGSLASESTATGSVGIGFALVGSSIVEASAAGTLDVAQAGGNSVGPSRYASTSARLGPDPRWGSSVRIDPSSGSDPVPDPKWSTSRPL